MKQTFEMCSTRTPNLGSSPCLKLAQLVCGSKNECASTQRCRAARQLVQMEYDELLKATHTGAETLSGEQCNDAEKDRSFFAPCTEVVQRAEAQE